MSDSRVEKLHGDTAKIASDAASPSTPVPRVAFLALIGANVTLAFGPSLVRLTDVGPVAAGFWRLALGLPFLAVLALWRGRGSGAAIRALPGTGWLLLLLAGIFFAADLASWHYGIVRTKLANATLFGNSSTLILPLWAAFVLRQRPRAIQVAALALAFAGAALMMGNSYELAPQNLTGDISCLFAGLFYTVYLLGLQRVRRELPSWTVLAASTAASVLPMLFFVYMIGERLMPHDWTPLIILALSSQVVGQGLMIYSIAYFTPLVIGLVLLVQPMVAAMVGWLWFGEALTATDAVGALAIATALVLVRLPEARKQ